MRFDGKTTRRRIRRLMIKETSLVPSAAQGSGARIAIMKRDFTDEERERLGLEKIEKPEDTVKRMETALTTTNAGHAHSIVMVTADGSGRLAELRSGQTSWVDNHAHYWIMDDADNVLIADAEGHSHGLAALVTKEGWEEVEKATFTAEQRRKLAQQGKAMPDGSYPIRNTSDLRNAIQAFGRAGNKAAVAKWIRRRAKELGAQNLLPKEGQLAQKSDPTEDNMSDQTPQLDELIKENERLARIVKLSPEHRAHFDSLPEDQRDEFLESESKDEIVKAAQADNEIVYKSRSGEEFRKSDDPRLAKMAKEMDDEIMKREQAEALAKRENLVKRAGEELKHLSGTNEAKADLLGAVDSLPTEKREPVLAILKSRDAGLELAMKELGTSDNGDDDSDPMKKIEALAKGIRAQNPSLTQEQAFVQVLSTPEGAELHEQYRASL